MLYIDRLQQESPFLFSLDSSSTFIIAFLFWNSTASTDLICEFSTQWLSFSPYYTNNLLEDTEKGFPLYRVWLTINIPIFPMYLIFKYMQWSNATFIWPFILSCYSCYLLLKRGLFVVGLWLRIFLRYQYSSISVKTSRCFFLKSSIVGVGFVVGILQTVIYSCIDRQSNDMHYFLLGILNRCLCSWGCHINK